MTAIFFICVLDSVGLGIDEVTFIQLIHLNLSALRSRTVNVILDVKFKLWLINDWFCSNLVAMSFLE